MNPPRWQQWMVWAGWAVSCVPVYIVLSSATWKLTSNACPRTGTRTLNRER